MALSRNDIEAAKRMKNKMWTPAFKPYYDTNDVLRYFKEREEKQNLSFVLNQQIKFTEPEKFFKKEVLEKGIEILKRKKLDKLKNKLAYLKNIKIPELEKEIVEMEEF